MESLISVKEFCEIHNINKHLQAGFLEHLRLDVNNIEVKTHSHASLQNEYQKFCGVQLASYPNPVTETENATDWLPDADNASKPSEVSGFAPLSFVSHEASEVSSSSNHKEVEALPATSLQSEKTNAKKEVKNK